MITLLPIACSVFAESHSETKSDSADAEKNREISDTSIAIYSQNPYIQSVMEKTTHIQAGRLKEIIARGDEIVLLDVRPRSGYEAKAGIEGTAMNIPRNFLEVEAYEQLSDKDAFTNANSASTKKALIGSNTTIAIILAVWCSSGGIPLNNTFRRLTIPTST